MTLLGQAVRVAARSILICAAVAVVLAIVVGPGSAAAIVAYVVVVVLLAVIVLYKRGLKRNARFYAAEIARGLDRAYTGDRVLRLTAEPDDLRLAIFSDLHRGTRDGADDHWRAERAYRAALAYYLRRGHSLVVLGDAEELWENDAAKVIAEYPEELALERRFLEEGRYIRVWGNHDIDWRSSRHLDKRLRKVFGTTLETHEAVEFRVGDGVLLLAHGHQGTPDSELFAAFSRPVVRAFGWAQRRFKRPWNTPANDLELRNRHDRAMFAWARARPENLVLIAGHTHRPVFWNSQPPGPSADRIAELTEQLEREERAGAPADQLARTHAGLEFLRAKERWRVGKPEPVNPPCYFNTGCCAFADGDATGLVIEDGEIKLVRLPDAAVTALPQELASAPLAEVLRQVREYVGSEA
jgi:predicted phosphodiesterase